MYHLQLIEPIGCALPLQFAKVKTPKEGVQRQHVGCSTVDPEFLHELGEL